MVAVVLYGWAPKVRDQTLALTWPEEEDHPVKPALEPEPMPPDHAMGWLEELKLYWVSVDTYAVRTFPEVYTQSTPIRTPLPPA